MSGHHNGAASRAVARVPTTARSDVMPKMASSQSGGRAPSRVAAPSNRQRAGGAPGAKGSRDGRTDRGRLDAPGRHSPSCYYAAPLSRAARSHCGPPQRVPRRRDAGVAAGRGLHMAAGGAARIDGARKHRRRTLEHLGRVVGRACAHDRTDAAVRRQHLLPGARHARLLRGQRRRRCPRHAGLAGNDGNPYAAHNFAVLLGFILSTITMYALARRLTGQRMAAAVAAVITRTARSSSPGPRTSSC